MIIPTSGVDHIVLGNGNVGTDLARELGAVTDSIITVPFDIIDSWRANSFPSLRGARTIWFCTGGRHAEAKMDRVRSHRLNVEVPRIIMDRADRDARLVFFSTGDAAHPEYPSKPTFHAPVGRSEFANQKIALEGTVTAQARPRTAVVRLSTVYGTSRPLATFPGRLLKSAWGPEALSFPANEVTPTPSEWIAVCLILAMEMNLWRDDRPTIHHLSPLGSIAAHDWAKIVFGNLRDARGFIDRRHLDETRPIQHQLGCSLQVPNEHWSTIWTIYFQREAYQ